MRFFLMAHSGVRYLVLLFGAIALLQALWAGVAKREYDATGRTLMRIYTGVLDLQVLLGLITLFTVPFIPQVIGHVITMVLAVVVAHIAVGINKRRPGSPRGYRLQLVGVALSLALILAGIMAIGAPVFGSRFMGGGG